VIVAIAEPTGPHTAAVLAALRRRGREPQTLLVRELARAGSLSASWRGRHLAVTARAGGRSLRLDQARAIWFCPPRPIELRDDLWRASHREWALAQWSEALGGLWDDLPARWVNHPARGESAGRKTLQLRTAAELGLQVPRTLVTSDPAAARGFVEEAGGPHRVVHKALRAVDGVWRETRLFEPGDLERLDALRHAPIVFQEYVPAEADLRVTVVGDEVFAAEIDARESSYPLDWRVDFDRARLAPAILPDAVAGSLRRLVRRLGLELAAIDLRRTPAGEHVFLEVNPYGLWLFVELRTGQPITDAIAAHLDAAPARDA
jgi:hypothetical protein